MSDFLGYGSESDFFLRIGSVFGPKVIIQDLSKVSYLLQSESHHFLLNENQLK